MKYDLLCAGLCCLDLIFCGLPEIPGPGEEYYCESFAVRAGGAANTAMAAARLGLRTALFSRAGTDLAGNMLRGEIASHGVDMSFVLPGGSTAVTAVLLPPSDRAFASYAGDGLEPSREAAFPGAVGQSRLVHSYLSYNSDGAMGRLCRECGTLLSLDSGFGMSLTNGERRLALTGCGILKVNEDEARALSGKEDIGEALTLLSSLGVPEVIVTLGAEGCAALIDGRHYRVRAYRTAVADTTGAGDAFSAGYLYGRLQGWDAERRLRFAAAAGSLSVSYTGGVCGAFTYEAVRDIQREAIC